MSPTLSQVFLAEQLRAGAQRRLDFRSFVTEYLRTHLALTLCDCVERRMLINPALGRENISAKELPELGGKLSVAATLVTQVLGEYPRVKELRSVESSTRRANHDPMNLDMMFFNSTRDPENEWKGMVLHVRLTYMEHTLSGKAANGDQLLGHPPTYIVSVMGAPSYVNDLLTRFDRSEVQLFGIDATEFDRGEAFE